MPWPTLDCSPVEPAPPWKAVGAPLSFCPISTPNWARRQVALAVAVAVLQSQLRAPKQPHDPQGEQLLSGHIMSCQARVDPCRESVGDDDGDRLPLLPLGSALRRILLVKSLTKAAWGSGGPWRDGAVGPRKSVRNRSRNERSHARGQRLVWEDGPSARAKLAAAASPARTPSVASC